MEEKQELTETLNEETKTFDALIEEKRLPLYKQFTTSRKVSNILTWIIMAIAVASMFLLVRTEAWCKPVGWGLLVAGLITMVVYYFLNKKKFEQNTKDYIEFVNATLNKEAFADPKFTDIDVTDTKLEVENVANNGVYTDVVRVASRNIMNGKYDGVSFKFAEAALFKKTDNKRQPSVAAFVGKYFEIENSIKYGGNIVINISRDEPVDAPNALEGRATLYGQDGITIYGEEGADFRAVIGEEFLGNIKKIKAENHLLNLALSIWEGHTYVFMSYDDDVIAMPFDKPLSADAFRSFVVDLKKVFNVVNMLGK